MKKRYFPVFVTSVVLAVTALVGYLIPDSQPQTPARILLVNTGGPVVFAHATHENIPLECRQCHHAGLNEQDTEPCGSCHAVEFDETFVQGHMENFNNEASCFTCHHKSFGDKIFDHSLHEEAAGDCQACHHDESIEPEPTNCSDCHQKEAADGVPSLKDANHARCADCHEDMFEAKLDGCSYCHASTPDSKIDLTAPPGCADCHTRSVSELVPPRALAFHAQCMGCHEKEGKGPFRNTEEVKDCNLCHLPN